MPVVTVENLKKVYEQHFMLDGITFQVQDGALCAVIGDEISGKKQLLETLAGLSLAAEGTINRPAECRYVPSGIVAYENVTADELFRHTMRLCNIQETEECQSLCEQFHIDRNRKLLDMTYMENRCAALVNALLSKPVLLMLDEPYNYLSDEVYGRLLNVIKQKCGQGMTALLTCERFDDIKNYATQYLFLKEGDLVLSGSLDDGFCPWKAVTVFDYEPAVFKGLKLEWVAQEKDRLCFIFKGDSKELLRLLVRTGCPDFLVEELTFEEQLFKNYERWRK